MTQQGQVTASAVEVQDVLTAETLAAVQQWAEAYIRRDIDAVMAAMTDDCIIELPGPPPDGARVEGKDAARAYWEELFRSSPTPVFETEEMLAVGDRCVFRWVRRWTDKDGNPQHIRDIDVFRVRDGKLSEKLVYLKSPPTFTGMTSENPPSA